MNMKSCILAGVIFFMCVAEAAYAASPRMIPSDFSSLAKGAGPAVVNIRTEKAARGGGRVFRHFFNAPGNRDPFQDFFDRYFDDDQLDQKQQSLGSGFIIDPEGYIVTNNHVIEGADTIKVKLNDEREFDAEIIGRDENTDLALIKVASESPLPILSLGTSASLDVGEWVVAIGSPFGLEQTVTAGIVSAKGRVIGSGPYDDFIQTDASINPGNSGGPLLNLSGEVVGINTAIIASGQGIGFAIPVDLARGIVDQLKNKGEVTRGWLGVSIQDLDADLSRYYGVADGKGVLILDVFDGDPAERAGIRAKDILIAINGKKVASTRDLTRRIAEKRVGEDVTVTLLRKGKKKTVTVEIGKRDEAELAGKHGGAPMAPSTLGMRVQEVTPEMAERYRLSKADAVIVTQVERGSAAATSGMHTGDIIKEINHQQIRSFSDYREVMGALKKEDALEILIKRMNVGLMVVRINP
ncbi:MAG: peptidase [Deltaproteobacteria bacterium]|nr:MAG: peptidase [Deltaproteobacteria bacterium]